MELLPEPDSPRGSFPFTALDWEQTPPAVQAYLHTLHDEMSQLQGRVEQLEARLNQRVLNTCATRRIVETSGKLRHPSKRETHRRA